MARIVVNHRGPECRTAIGETQEMIRPILGTTNHVLFFASSGTGVMEAALVNVVGPGSRILVIEHGQFGERFTTIAKAMNITVDTVAIEWGQAIDVAAVGARLREHAYRAVVVVHNESSTGIVADLAALGALVCDRPTLLIADSVSGLGGIEMRQDEWGVDIVVSASQKALMCPPGLAHASVSAKAWRVIGQDERRSTFYWDFRRALKSAEQNETAFTAPVSLIYGLREALTMIHEEGFPNVLVRHRKLSAALRAGGAALGLADFCRDEPRSSTVVVFKVPDGLEGGAIVRQLYQDHRTVIAGARNRLSGRVIRFGTMGALSTGTILTDLLHLEDALTKLGLQIEPGAGLKAATEYLAATA
ncbi:alanine--glyoxylate aminotransferase family protein [Bradyrhizobium jicamae]|uniref:Alanine--glyoxylate aminotransferase family protein n=1 Tax=Bradyrhizobium jicamae TaxID=280332 RepID=A0ABS5FF06_9BRAD|nr:alanine--glyoxylate aminotransferase family protein [Bradyrhizobium jicamae]MBR0794926.1 alanine--glyoxylate aminotransferase family protein [Bradyrhizobium jicamae]MBR0938888.1 alanine--glyoxylate aminotransferase family protein [Bradyrhizobium jicamae]